MGYERRRPIVDIAPIVEYTPEQIRDIRMMAGISQKQLANATGISVTTIQFAEAKKGYTPPRYLYRFLEMLEQNPTLFEEYGILTKIKFQDDENEK